MAHPLDGKFVVAISSRSLFDLEEADALFRGDGLPAYREYQREHEDEPLQPGTGFRLVKALLALNARTAPDRVVEAVIMSRNDADSGLRILNSAEAHGLDIKRGAFRNGRDPWRFLQPFHSSLFLTKEPGDVVEAIKAGFAAALTLDPPEPGDYDDDLAEVRIALDGDAVLFSDESERVFQEQGIEGFMKHEAENVDVPLPPGPFKPFLDALARLQERFPEEPSPIRTLLVTARNFPAHKRVIKTLRTWNVRIDESYFLGGVDKASVVSELRPHIYFDDQLKHLETTRLRTPAGHVLAAPFPQEEQKSLGLVQEAGKSKAAPRLGRSRKRAVPPLAGRSEAKDPGTASDSAASVQIRDTVVKQLTSTDLGDGHISSDMPVEVEIRTK